MSEKRSKKKWTQPELDIVKKGLQLGWTPERIKAHLPGRTVIAIRCKMTDPLELRGGNYRGGPRPDYPKGFPKELVDWARANQTDNVHCEARMIVVMHDYPVAQ